MTLETISGALLLFYIILFPLIITMIALIAYSFNYWREKRRENKEPPDMEECRVCGSRYDLNMHHICPYCEEGEDE